MIEVQHLTKCYGDFKAVDDLSFCIEDNGVYGFLGPNGAGKSTTMNIMTGCLSMNDGNVVIEGHDIFEEPEEVKKCIGYLPEIPPVYVDLTVNEYLEFVAEAKGIEKKNLSSEIQKVLKETQIENVQEKLIRNLSKGYRQRVGIAQALLHNPKIIILDEPTVGLDPMQIIEIRDLIEELGKTHTVILSSHILSEVQAICQKIIIINKGKLIANDTPDNLEKLMTSSSKIEIIVEGKQNDVNQILNKSGYAYETSKVGNKKLSIQMDVDSKNSEECCKKLFFDFADKRIPILQMKTSRVNLEEIFIELTKVEEEGEKE